MKKFGMMMLTFLVALGLTGCGACSDEITKKQGRSCESGKAFCK